MRVVGPDDNLCVFGAEVLHKRIERFGHVSVPQIPRGDSVAKHRTVILLSILHQAGILFRKEEFVWKNAAIATRKIGNTPAHFHPLVDSLIFAALSQTKAGRVSVGLRVLAEMFEAAITITSAACRFGVNLIQEVQNGADGSMQAVEVQPIKARARQLVMVIVIA